MSESNYEVYPALWSRSFAREGRKWRPARRLQHRARRPEWRLAAARTTLAQVEGWILRVPGFILAGKERNGPGNQPRHGGNFVTLEIVAQ
jgi:hypothetical protein